MQHPEHESKPHDVGKVWPQSKAVASQVTVFAAESRQPGDPTMGLPPHHTAAHTTWHSASVNGLPGESWVTTSTEPPHRLGVHRAPTAATGVIREHAPNNTNHTHPYTRMPQL